MPSASATRSPAAASTWSGASGCAVPGTAPKRAARLDRAVEQLRTCGATSYAERAIVELRAAGGVVDDDARTSELLTAHELQVARLVVGGLSNRDLAARLFISPRTVEAHLTAIFRKLGVANRRELSARALGDVSLQP